MIPTFGRPAFLRRCYEALSGQRRRPDVVVIVTRDVDLDSRHAVEELDRRGPLPIVHGVVSAPGHLPPLEVARELLDSAIDAVLVVDDDMLLHRRAIADVMPLLHDPTVGAVGGRFVEHHHGTAQPAVLGRGGGELSFAGWIYAGHSHAPECSRVREVDWAPGGLVVYRRRAFDAITIRPCLNGNVAVGYEIDWGLQLAAMGYRVLYQPRFSGDHHNAPRRHGVDRRAASRLPENVFWRNHNHTYILLHHFRGLRRCACLLNSFTFGNHGDWGLGLAAYVTVRRKTLWHWRMLPAAYRGKLAGLRRFARERRGWAS